MAELKTSSLAPILMADGSHEGEAARDKTVCYRGRDPAQFVLDMFPRDTRMKLFAFSHSLPAWRCNCMVLGAFVVGCAIVLTFLLPCHLLSRDLRILSQCRKVSIFHQIIITTGINKKESPLRMTVVAQRIERGFDGGVELLWWWFAILGGRS